MQIVQALPLVQVHSPPVPYPRERRRLPGALQSPLINYASPANYCINVFSIFSSPSTRARPNSNSPCSVLSTSTPLLARIAIALAAARPQAPQRVYLPASPPVSIAWVTSAYRYQIPACGQLPSLLGFHLLASLTFAARRSSNALPYYVFSVRSSICFAFPLPHLAPAPHWDLQHPSPPPLRSESRMPDNHSDSLPTSLAGYDLATTGTQSLYDDSDGARMRTSRHSWSWGWA
ncbi:hypothetical protein B0H13DRAFT_2579188 [Mycena leptocephala]|nr:hypothetical protein B0H13DRAFT_2579188 [Mycena leptocephala]